MSWFRRGSSKDDSSSSDSSYLSDSAPSSSFSESPGSFSGPNLAAGSGASSAAAAGNLQEVLAAEQQKAMVNQVISKLTEMAFTKCVEKPSSSLSSREESCIHSTVLKYMDTSEFVLGRMLKSQGGAR